MLLDFRILEIKKPSPFFEGSFWRIMTNFTACVRTCKKIQSFKSQDGACASRWGTTDASQKGGCLLTPIITLGACHKSSLGRVDRTIHWESTAGEGAVQHPSWRGPLQVTYSSPTLNAVLTLTEISQITVCSCPLLYHPAPLGSASPSA